MPKNKFQDVIFTIIMVFVMVYTMICYNIALNVGGMNNQVFLNAFHELVIMGPIAFILDFFLIGPFAKKKAFSIVNLERDNNFHLVIAISVESIRSLDLLNSFLFDALKSFFHDILLKTCFVYSFATITGNKISCGRKKNVPWHILAPAAIACDIFLIRRSAHPRGAFLYIRKEHFPNI